MDGMDTPRLDESNASPVFIVVSTVNGIPPADSAHSIAVELSPVNDVVANVDM